MKDNRLYYHINNIYTAHKKAEESCQALKETNDQQHAEQFVQNNVYPELVNKLTEASMKPNEKCQTRWDNSSPSARRSCYQFEGKYYYENCLRRHNEDICRLVPEIVVRMLKNEGFDVDDCGSRSLYIYMNKSDPRSFWRDWFN